MVTVYARQFPEETGRKETGWGSRQVRLLLREALRLRFPGLLELPPMERDVFGKPFFPDYPEIYFSLSHTRDGVCCALADAPVGVDMEYRRPRKHQEQIVRRFSREEQKLWEQTPEEEREQLFFRLWVLKESYVKADGRGLRIPLDSFSVLPKRMEGIGKAERIGGLPGEGWSVLISGDGGDREYYFRSYEMGKFYSSIAVCSLDGEMADKVYFL